MLIPAIDTKPTSNCTKFQPAKGEKWIEKRHQTLNLSIHYLVGALALPLLQVRVREAGVMGQEHLGLLGQEQEKLRLQMNSSQKLPYCSAHKITIQLRACKLSYLRQISETYLY